MLQISEGVKLTMKRSIIVLFLFCAFNANHCEDIVNGGDVETVQENGSSGTHSGKMVNYDDFMGELDGYPDFNNNDNYDWSK